MVVLGVVERPGLGDLGRDLAEARARQLLLEHRARRLGRLALRVGRPVDRGAVLRAGVVPLAHPLGRVVALPEEPQQLLVARQRRVEHDEDGLGVARLAAADLAVGRIRREAAGVADRRRVDAGRAPEDALGAPEAAHADDQLLESVRERRLERRAEHLVARGHGHALAAAWECVFGCDERRGLAEEEHASRVRAGRLPVRRAGRGGRPEAAALAAVNLGGRVLVAPPAAAAARPDGRRRRADVPRSVERRERERAGGRSAAAGSSRSATSA